MMTILDSLRDYKQTCYENCCLYRPQGMIARSRLGLDSTTRRLREPVTLKDIDQKVIDLAKKHHLNIPDEWGVVDDPDYSVAMSLKFLNHYRQTSRIDQTAQKMAEGVDKTCLAGSHLFHAISQANATNDDDKFVYKINSVMAGHFGMGIDREVLLHLPAEDMYAYFSKKLIPGEYLITLPYHTVALVKDNQNRLYLYDPAQGTVRLASSVKWFLKQLVVYKVHLSEKLWLHRMQDGMDLPYANTVISNALTQAQPQLTIKETKGRWGLANFKWRGKNFDFVRDRLTHEIYNADSTWLIRGKCIMLCPGTVLATAARIIGHIALGILHLLSISLCLGTRIADVNKDFVNARRALFYGVRCFGAALYGILLPYEGRRLYGHFERCLNRHTNRIMRREAFYLAPCFTPLTFNAVDKSNQDVIIEKLKKAILWSEYFQKIIDDQL